MNQDADHLRLLSIFHFVVAGIVGLFSLFPLIHVAFGIAMLFGGFDEAKGGSPPPFLGWLFIVFPLFFIATGLAISFCIALAGFKLKRRSSHLYCLVIACIECLFMPFGTVLGVFTIIVLVRPSVKLLFGVTPDSSQINEPKPW